MKMNKKFVIFFLVLMLSFVSTLSQYLLADEEVIALIPTTLVEHVFVGDYDTFEEQIDLAKLGGGEDYFLLVNLPHRFNEASLTTSDTQLRGDIYCQPIQSIPVIAVNGLVDPRDKESSSHWREVIQKGYANHQNMADFTYTTLSNGKKEVIAKGTSEELSKFSEVNLNVICFQDFVPCQFANGDTTIRNLARKFPVGPLGQKVNVKKDKTALVQFDLSIPDEYRNMYGLIAILQDMKTNRILAVSYMRFSDKKEPAYFSWNHWPKVTFDYQNNQLLDEYMIKTGVAEMTFSVENASNLRLLQLEMDYTKLEKDIYEILGCYMVKELEGKATLDYDPDKKKVNLYFSQPIDGSMDLFTFAVHWKKENLDTSSSFKVRAFYPYNTQNNLLFFDLNDIKQYYPNMLLIVNHPLDFTKDSWIDHDDLFLMMPFFGLTGNDPLYQTKYDIDQSDQQKRIDMADISTLMKEINSQYRIQKRIRNPSNYK